MNLMLRNDHKYLLFWAVALIGLVLPWGCQHRWGQGTTYEGCAVASVHDGDTLRTDCGGDDFSVRFYCIDAPEIEQKPWGIESRDYLRSRLPHGATVTLAVKDKDRYGRTVAEVLRDGHNLNLDMVRTGHAVVYPAFCHEQRFYEAEKQALAAHLGVWDKPGEQQTPWKFRHQ